MNGPFLPLPRGKSYGNGCRMLGWVHPPGGETGGGVGGTDAYDWIFAPLFFLFSSFILFFSFLTPFFFSVFFLWKKGNNDDDDDSAVVVYFKKLP